MSFTIPDDLADFFEGNLLIVFIFPIPEVMVMTTTCMELSCPKVGVETGMVPVEVFPIHIQKILNDRTASFCHSNVTIEGNFIHSCLDFFRVPDYLTKSQRNYIFISPEFGQTSPFLLSPGDKGWAIGRFAGG